MKELSRRDMESDGMHIGRLKGEERMNTTLEVEDLEEMLDKDFINLDTYARFLGIRVCKEV